MTFPSIRQTWYFRLIGFCLVLTFVTSLVITPKAYAQAGIVGLPQPGTRVDLSPAYVPLMLTGLRVHPENPLLMDFIVSTGNSGLNVGQVKEQSDRLIKYFLACLTIPEKDQWVNLSPYEKQRIVPEDLGQTVLGQDMLAQDYILKQLTASLIYPERNLGRNFWDKVYAQAREIYGTTQIPVNTFNKVWILPQYAKVYEHQDTVLVVKSHLKVMLDEDYRAMNKHADINSSNLINPAQSSQINNLGSQIVRQIILPAIEQEVNTGKNFAQMRQIYNSMILAVWFKNNLKQAFLNQVYTDKAKVNGVNADDPAMKEMIYRQYLEAYKKGVFNYIKEEVDQKSRQVIPRKYFSGGLTTVDGAMISKVGPEVATRYLEEQPADSKTFLESSEVGGIPKRNSGIPNEGAKKILDRAIIAPELTVNQARILMPELDYHPGKVLDLNLIHPRLKRNAEQVIALLQATRQRGVELRISGFLRGLDGAGSSLDLPEFQKALTDIGAEGFNQLPSTTAVASDKRATIRFELADDPNVVEYVAPDYGITEDKPLRFTEDVKLVNGRLPNKQRDAVGYIFRNIFKLRGVRIVMEGISPIALAGGMESSNTFNVGLLAAGSMLSAANLSYADIVALAVKLENDEFGGLTGGQGHWATILGRAQRLIWASGVKGSDGKLLNHYGVVAEEVLNDAQIASIEQHTMLVQAGKEYKDGKALVGRTASLTNNMWTDLLRYDSIGQELHKEKLELAARYAKAMSEGDFKTVFEVLNRYVDIRDAITKRWISLMMDAKQGKQGVPDYAHEFVRKVFGPYTTKEQEAEMPQDYEVIRNLYLQHEQARTLDQLREISLYTLDPIATLIKNAREADIAIFPLGAGGPGSNMMAVSPQGLEHMQLFFETQGVKEITDEIAAKIVKGTGTLKGYMPFKVGREGIKIEGFDQLADAEGQVQKPALPSLGTVQASGIGLARPVAAFRVLPENAYIQTGLPAIVYGKDHNNFRMSVYQERGKLLISLLLPVQSSLNGVTRDLTGRLIEMDRNADEARVIHQKLEADGQLWQTIITAPIATSQERDALMEKILSAISKHDLAMKGEVKARDLAAFGKAPGGIDLNAKNLNLQSEGQKVSITFDPALIAQFKRGDFSGVKIQILDVVPINLIPLIGLKEDEMSERLA